MSIASIIQDQVGNKAFTMMGARDLIDTGTSTDALGGLRWRVGRNAKRVQWVQVTLKADDTYTVTFTRMKRAPSYEVVTLAEHDGIYFDMLHGIIESETGMYLTLCRDDRGSYAA